MNTLNLRRQVYKRINFCIFVLTFLGFNLTNVFGQETFRHPVDDVQFGIRVYNWTSTIVNNKRHTGVDYMGVFGDPIYAAASGEIVHKESMSANDHGFGYNYIIKHNMLDGSIKYSFYGHMETLSTLAIGDSVYKGQQIGTMGNSGNGCLNYWNCKTCNCNDTEWAHLHFEIKSGEFDETDPTDNYCGTGPVYGYSINHPDDYCYHDPRNYTGPNSIAQTATPELVLPVNNSTNISTPVTFNWSIIPNAIYRLQVLKVNPNASYGFTPDKGLAACNNNSTCNECNNELVVNVNTTDFNYYTWDSNVLNDVCELPEANATYVWTVKSFANGVGSTYSYPQTFTVTGNENECSELLGSSTNAKSNSSPQLFINTICNDENYTVEVEIENIDYEFDYSLNVGGQIQNNVLPQHTYTFYGFTSEQVTNVNLYQTNSPSCGITESVSKNCLVLAPNFTYPDFFLTQPTNIAFRWNRPINPTADRYRIQITNQPNPTIHPEFGFYISDPRELPANNTIVVNKYIQTSSNNPRWTWNSAALSNEVFTTPQPDETYYIIIRAANANSGSAGWSFIQSFTIQSPTATPAQISFATCPTITPNSLIQGQNARVTVEVTNNGQTDWEGDIAATINSDGVNGREDIEIKEDVSIAAGASKSIFFYKNEINYPVGDHLLSIVHAPFENDPIISGNGCPQQLPVRIEAEPTPPGPPDYRITAVTPSTNRVEPGDDFTLEVMVSNNGDTAPNTRVVAYLTDNDNTNYRLGSIAFTEIAASGSQTQSATMQVPTYTDNGTYTIRTVVDQFNSVDEINENNNTNESATIDVSSYTTCPQPTNFTHSYAPTAQFPNKVEIRWNPIEDISHYSWSLRNNGSTVQSGVTTDEENYVILFNLDDCERYFFDIETVCTNGFKSNNSVYDFSTRSALGSPDLSIGNESLSKNQVAAGDNITITYDGRNPVGDYCGSFDVAFFLDDNENINDGSLANFTRQTITENLSQMNGQVAVTKSKSITIPNTSPGIRYIVICADIDDRVDERDEEDNCTYVPIEIYDPNNLPNLQLQNVSINGATSALTVYSEQQVDLVMDIHNTGPNSTTKNFYTTFWIDNNSNPDDGTPTFVFQRYNSIDLAAGQSVARSVGIDLPTLNPGNYKAIICIDRSKDAYYDNRVVEASEVDNCFVLDLSVNGACNDPYEPNDIPSQIYRITPDFSTSNTYIFETVNACIAEGEADYSDFFQFHKDDLNDTYNYEVTFTPIDRSTNPSYSGLIEYELFDSGLPRGEFTNERTYTVTGGDHVEWEVYPRGGDRSSVGTYAFRVTITRTPTSSCVDPYEPNNGIFTPDEATPITMNFGNGNTFIFETNGACSFAEEEDTDDIFKIENWPSGYDYTVTATPIDVDNGAFSAKVEMHLRNITGSVQSPYIYTTSMSSVTHEVPGNFDEPLYFILYPEDDTPVNTGSYQLRVEVTRTAWVSTGADLVMDYYSVPSTIANGTETPFGFTVQNIGRSAVGSTSRVHVYINQSSTRDGSEVEVDSDNVYVDLQPGEYFQGTNFIADINGFSPGNYHIIFCVDGNNDIHEDNENNNCVSVPVTVINTPPPMTIISPNGGEDRLALVPSYEDYAGLPLDETYITWVQGSCGRDVTVSISYDGGTNWEVIEDAIIRDGFTRIRSSYYQVSDNVKVRVSCSSGSDESDSSFRMVTGLPRVANDSPCNAFNLDVNSDCRYQASTIIGTTLSDVPIPADYSGGFYSDVWFSAIVPNSGALNLATSDVYRVRPYLAAYSGTCSSLTYIGRNISRNDALELNNLTPGQTIFIRAWHPFRYGKFDICITNPESGCDLSIANYNVTNSTCEQNNGSISSVTIVGGTGNITYQWKDGTGNVISTATNINNLGADIYSLRVVDSEGCIATENITISGSTVPQIANYDLQDATCGAANGAVNNVIISNGTSPFNYNYQNTAGTTIGTNATISNLIDGNYSLTVRDANNCETTESFTIANGVGPVITGHDVVAATCGQSNGSVTGVSAEGGTGTLTYRWTNDNGNTVSNNQDLMEQIAGTYTLSVTDANNCSSSLTVDITNSDSPAINGNNVQVVGENCGNQNGSITGITTSGGSGNLSYVWYLNSNVISTDLNPTSLGSGNHNLEVTDSEGCVASLTVNVPANGGPTVNTNNVFAESATCGESNGSIIGIRATGGTGTLERIWKDSEGTVLSTAANLINVPAGDYTFIVEDANGCTAMATVTVPSADSPIINADGIAITGDECGANSGAIAGLQASGGSGTLSYEWRNLNDDEVGNTLELTGQPAGSYRLIVTDANNCTAEYEAAIPQTAGPTIIDYTVTNASCDDPNGSINNVTIIGGSGTFVYEWQDATGNIVSANSSLTNVAEGIYTLNVLDDRNCLGSATITVDNLSGPAITNFTATDAACGTDNGMIGGIEISDGTPPYSYLWRNSNGNIFSADPMVSNLAGGNYTLIVTDDNFCTDEISIVIEQPEPITYYEDSDNDGFGNSQVSHTTCEGSGNRFTNAFVPNSLDCDDSDDNIFPGSAEVCDEIDNNCNGRIDENSCSNSLPLQLLTFTAHDQKEGVKLRWSTATERSISEYVILRSTDGKDWVAIGQVAANNQEQNDYQYWDRTAKSANTPTLYYRLRIVEADVTDSYSPVRRVTLSEETTQLTVFPNPATSSVRIGYFITSSPVNSYLLEIIDVRGSIVRQIPVKATESYQEQQVDLQRLPTGVYLVKLQLNDRIFTQRLIVQ